MLPLFARCPELLETTLRDRMAREYMFTFALLLVIIGSFIVLGFAVWAWGLFLDRYEHDPGRVRAVMSCILFAVSVTEMALVMSGVTQSWVLWISFVVNVWGGVDALLRFPAAHELESFFSLKQFSLLGVKTLAYGFGMSRFRRDVSKFFVILLLMIWGLPVIFLMALPLDPAEQVVKDDAQDVDILAKLWQLARCGKQRRQYLATCRTWWNRNLVAVAEISPLARFVIGVASPAIRRNFKKTGRTV